MSYHRKFALFIFAAMHGEELVKAPSRRVVSRLLRYPIELSCTAVLIKRKLAVSLNVRNHKHNLP